jgi:hypothetical protein
LTDSSLLQLRNLHMLRIRPFLLFTERLLEAELYRVPKEDRDILLTPVS